MLSQPTPLTFRSWYTDTVMQGMQGVGANVAGTSSKSTSQPLSPHKEVSIKVTPPFPPDERVSAYSLELGEIVYVAINGLDDIRIKTAIGMIDKGGLRTGSSADLAKTYKRYPKGSKVVIEYLT